MSRRDDFENQISDLIGIPWGAPPKRATSRARKRPSVDPVPPPPSRASKQRIRPADVRSATAEADATAMLSRTFPGMGVTLMVTPPEGDALWKVQGRIWLDDESDGPIRVVLSAGDNVLAVEEIQDGGSFLMEEILLGAWSLEFHLASGDVHVLEGPESS